MRILQWLLFTLVVMAWVETLRADQFELELVDLAAGDPAFAQTVERPAVIAASADNPEGFEYFDPRDHHNVVVGTGWSHTVGQIRSILGDFFSIGIKVNQEEDSAIQLRQFKIQVEDDIFKFVGDSSILERNDGTLSDARLTSDSLNLSNYADDSLMRFRAHYQNNDGGDETFFLMGGGGGGGNANAVPEPGSLIVWSLGLALGFGAYITSRRRIARQDSRDCSPGEDSQPTIGVDDRTKTPTTNRIERPVT